MDFDIKEVEKRFITYSKNNIYLTGEQVEVLNNYSIDYTKCKTITELINLIERYKDDDNFDELDWVQTNLSEFNYYHNTNK